MSNILVQQHSDVDGGATLLLPLEPQSHVAWTPGEDETIAATTTGATAGKVSLRVLTSGTTSRTLTFGTNFKSTGTLATGTVSAKVLMIGFLFDGTNFCETGRTTAM